MYRPDFVGKDPTAEESLAAHFLFHDAEPEAARWGLTTLRLLNAKQAIVEPCPLTAWPDLPTAYISCRQDRTIDPDWWEAAAVERLRVEPIRIDAGHFPHVSKPSVLAAVLDDFARTLPPRPAG